jgi:ribonuclease HI
MADLTSRAAVFAALAQGQDLDRIREGFQLSPEELQDLFQEVAEHYQDLEQGTWTLYCDGASRGNPGPAGAGALLMDPQGEIRARLSQYLGSTTNNVAEYQALLLGLREAHRLGVRKIKVFADSELLVRQLNGSYRVKAPHLLPLWQEAQKGLQSFETQAISHVPREENSQADGLANRAIDQQAGNRVK